MKIYEKFPTVENVRHVTIYLPCNFEVNPITHFGVIALFSSNVLNFITFILYLKNYQRQRERLNCKMFSMSRSTKKLKMSGNCVNSYYVSLSNEGRHIDFFLLLLLSKACRTITFFVFPDRSIIFGMWVHNHKAVCCIP